MNRNKKRAASNGSVSSLEDVWTGDCKIQLLPPNIIIDILSRLPIKTILSCKRVCKGWLRLISHPRFVELQLARSSTAILIKTIPSVNHSRKITLTHVDQRGPTPFRLDKLVLTPKSNLPGSKFGLVNSCNGLLCLFGVDKEDPIWVCNPILGEYVTVPSPSKGKNRGSFVGLGFCTVTNRYKVLQTFHPKVKGSGKYYLNAEIYCMDTGTWRSIGYAPGDPVALPFNSLLHGSLHWVPIVETKTFRRTSVTGTRNQFDSIALTPSLVSLYRVTRGELVQRVQGRKEECANLSAQGTVDCAGFGTSRNEPARLDSTLYQDHPGVTFQFQNPDHRTQYMSTANTEYFDHITAQGFSTPHINDVSGNLASMNSHPFLWHL